MARFRVKRYAEDRGLKNPTDLMRATGISYSLARELWKDTDLNLEIETLRKIAAAFNVKVTDLIIEDAATEAPEQSNNGTK